MTTQFTIKGISQLMKNLGGYEQVAVARWARFCFKKAKPLWRSVTISVSDHGCDSLDATNRERGAMEIR